MLKELFGDVICLPPSPSLPPSLEHFVTVEGSPLALLYILRRFIVRVFRLAISFMAWNQRPGQQPGYNPAYVSIILLGMGVILLLVTNIRVHFKSIKLTFSQFGIGLGFRFNISGKMQTLSDPIIVLQEVKLLSGNRILCLPQYSVLILAF